MLNFPTKLLDLMILNKLILSKNHADKFKKKIFVPEERKIHSKSKY